MDCRCRGCRRPLTLGLQPDHDAGFALLRVEELDILRHPSRVAIHPTAVIDTGARLDSTVEVGPYAVIDAGVQLGANCRVGPHVHLTGCTTAGARNVFGTGCVIGGPPQDIRFDGSPTRLRMGDDNVFREHVTVHCANRMDEDTRLGSGNLLMAHAHIGHNACVGDRVIIANGAQLGGHVILGDRAFISANCLIHQFVRVGTLALMQGGAAISKDLPPYCIAWGDNSICGLNTIGLRRAGMSAPARLELRRLYRAVFRSQRGLKNALSTIDSLVSTDAGRVFVDFLRSSRRGVVTHRPRGPIAIDSSESRPDDDGGDT
ncbi:MAG: acyl-ACP--UDP-N-acetylglucosamine O-acyltransferase [Verrucomicrobiales bacterium]|nr:acyl-ACP--UDP-N-acetylglucosamine O-acyltransferase [Verrucomicrobiales bacterium]